MRQHARAVRHDRRAEPAHRTAARNVFVVDRLCLAVQTRRQFLRRLPGVRAFGKRALHPIDRPEQIDGGRPSGRHEVAQLLELNGELSRPFCRAAPHAERQTHRRRDANCRRAANHHRLDGARDLRAAFATHVDFLGGQLALIHHDDDIVLKIDRGKHVLNRLF